MTLTVNFLPELAASVFGIILCFCLRFKYTDATEANIYYRQMAYGVTAATLADVISTVVHNLNVFVPPFVFMFNTTLFYIATVSAGYLLLRYVTMRAEKQNGRYFRTQKYLLFADIALLLLNFVTHTFYHYDTNGTIVYGTFHLPVAYGVAFWFILSSCIVQGIHSGKYTRLQRVVLRASGVSMLVAFIIQFFFLRNLMFSYAVGILSVYLIFFAVELPVYVRLEEATNALLERQKEAEKAAQKALFASRAKSGFLANTSHEIRTPMNAILGMNDMIMQGTNDIRIKGASFEIREAGESLLQIINDVLDYSRIESGKMEMVTAAFSVGALLAETDRKWREVIEARDVRFRVGIADAIGDTLYSDRAKLLRILDNLISNAAKYTEEGRITLQVSGEQNGAEQGLAFRVEDTGTGIREEELERVFSLFTRAALEENRDKQGTGLGLKIADELARMLGGNIRAESTFGKGSRFTLFLPLAETKDEGKDGASARAVYEKERRSHQAERPGKSFRAEGKRVLIVDDTVVNLTIVSRMVRDTGAEADTVMSGAECLKSLGEQADAPYDLVLLDYMMPEMDGIKTLEMIRMIPGCEKGTLPVVALTASIDESTAFFFLKAGFDDYLAKPVKASLLCAVLEKHMKSASQKRDGT